jgi:hypothetical protein
MDFKNEEIMLLNEGGAAGHLAHPFEDADLTFGDMKEMINRGLIGGLDKEAPVTEKLDGQNIAFSVKDGKIVFARNKGHVRNRGENALDRDGIGKQFAGRGGIEKAFTGAAEDLEAAVQKLSSEQVKKMFGNGSKFMSLEVILPDTQNVIPYGKSVLVMHGTISYDKDGNETGRNAQEGRDFGEAVKKVGADRQKTFGIAGAQSIVFSSADEQENKKKAREYNSNLDKSAKEFGLSDKSKLSDYRKKWWEREISKEEKKSGFKFTKSEKSGLIKRWADGDKGFGVNGFQDDKKKAWFRNYEKSSLEKSQKSMIRPIENTFLKAGAQTLKRATNFVASNNPETSKQVKKDVATAIKAIKDSKDPAKLAKLRKELDRLKEIGMDNVVPSEGVVFMYKGKPYKFTGAFAPINQINGTFKFDKPKDEKPEAKPKEKYKKEAKKDEKKKAEKQPKRTIAVFAGRFQPFHAGHYSVYQELVKRFGKDNVYIASSDVTDEVRSPFKFSEKQEIITSMFDVPKDHVVQVKNPYQPVEVLKGAGKDTAYVTAVSQKDAERLDKGGKYFKNYDKTPKGTHKNYKEEGYYIIAPEMQLKVNGGNISGTQLRATFGNEFLSDSEKRDIFTQVYGKFNKDIYNKIVKKTTKAEEAKVEIEKIEKQKKTAKAITKKTDTGKKDKKEKSVSLDKDTRKKLKDVLKTKIKNPETGNKIYVSSALKYKKGSKVRRAAEDEIKKALKTKNENFPGGVFTGLTSPAGYINGAPNPKRVKNMRKKLNSKEKKSVNENISLVDETIFNEWASDYFGESVVAEEIKSVNTKDTRKIQSLKEDSEIYNPIARYHVFNDNDSPLVPFLFNIIQEEVQEYIDTHSIDEADEEGGKPKKEKEPSEAEKMGLVYRGYGRYAKDKSGPITHKSEDGKIRPLTPAEAEEENRKEKGAGAAPKPAAPGASAAAGAAPAAGQPAAAGAGKEPGKKGQQKPPAPSPQDRAQNPQAIKAGEFKSDADKAEEKEKKEKAEKEKESKFEKDAEERLAKLSPEERKKAEKAREIADRENAAKAQMEKEEAEAFDTLKNEAFGFKNPDGTKKSKSNIARAIFGNATRLVTRAVSHTLGGVANVLTLGLVKGFNPKNVGKLADKMAAGITKFVTNQDNAMVKFAKAFPHNVAHTVHHIVDTVKRTGSAVNNLAHLRHPLSQKRTWKDSQGKEHSEHVTRGDFQEEVVVRDPKTGKPERNMFGMPKKVWVDKEQPKEPDRNDPKFKNDKQYEKETKKYEKEKAKHDFYQSEIEVPNDHFDSHKPESSDNPRTKKVKAKDDVIKEHEANKKACVSMMKMAAMSVAAAYGGPFLKGLMTKVGGSTAASATTSTLAKGAQALSDAAHNGMQWLSTQGKIGEMTAQGLAAAGKGAAAAGKVAGHAAAEVGHHVLHVGEKIGHTAASVAHAPTEALHYAFDAMGLHGKIVNGISYFGGEMIGHGTLESLGLHAPDAEKIGGGAIGMHSLLGAISESERAEYKMMSEHFNYLNKTILVEGKKVGEEDMKKASRNSLASAMLIASKAAPKIEKYEMTEEQYAEMLEKAVMFKKLKEGSDREQEIDKTKDAAADMAKSFSKMLKEDASEAQSHSRLKLVKEFVEWCSERLKLKERPRVKILSNKSLPEAEQPSLGGYIPHIKEIYVVMEGRLIADVLRTIAHEMVHHKQYEMNLIKNIENDGKTGSEIENKANSVAGILLREYGKLQKKIYTESTQKKNSNDKVKSSEEHYVPTTGIFSRNLTPQQKIDKLNPARAIQKAKIWHKTFAHHNPETGEVESKNMSEAIVDDTIDSTFAKMKEKIKASYPSLQSIKYDTHDKTYTFIFNSEKEANTFRTKFKGTKSQIAQFDKIDYEPKQSPNTFFVKFKTQFKEDINLPVNVGDTVLMGKFKNKKVKVKDIGKDHHDMPTINGRPAATFRTKKESLNEVSALAGSDAQPDGAFLPKGKTRILGRNDNVNKTDKWFTNGGYTQTDFPTADAIFGDEDAELVTVWYSHENVPRQEEKLKTDFIKETLNTNKEYEKYTNKLLEIIRKK